MTNDELAARVLAVRDRIALLNVDVDKPSATKDEPDLMWACAELREIASALRLRRRVVESLDNALENDYWRVREWPARKVALDLHEYDADLEDVDPDVLEPIVRAWQEARR